MSLKAGRKGLHKSLVDAFGFLKGEMPTGDYYTKTQTDNKFETKTHVNNTFQKKTLEVPIEMLSGSKLTVEDALQGLNEEKFTYTDNGILGAKNLLKNSATTQTINGVTFTVNADGSVTANGTATANVSFSFGRKDFVGNYIYTGCPSGGSADTYRINISDYTSGSEVGLGYDYGDGFALNLENVTNILSYIRIANGYTANNLVFRPMLRLATDPDDTYAPYAMTNRELTEELAIKESEVTNIVEGATVVHNDLVKVGKIVHMSLTLTNVTVAQYGAIARVPNGYIPLFLTELITSDSGRHYFVTSDGLICPRVELNNSGMIVSGLWITS